MEWALEPRGCGTAFRTKNPGSFFQTTETVGRICPNVENPEWALQVPIPQNSRINLLFNGFCGSYQHRKRTCTTEVLTPEPGVLWGRFNDIPAPVLISDNPLTETDGLFWLESDAVPALLAVRNGHFCLVTKARIFHDARQIAEDYLSRDIEALLQTELEKRKGASELFEHMTHHDSLAAISAECMMRAIRPPEGSISTHWSQSKENDDPQLNTNEIHPLALAWQHLDSGQAEELFLGVLKLQNNSGAIPVTYAPQKTFSLLEAPKPLLAKTAEKIWKAHKSPLFLAEVIPLLRRHLQWLLHHFDPKRRGLHHWQNSTEPLLPETYETEFATVDLTVLLLTEIEALNRLQEQSPDAANHNPFFTTEHDTLANNLETQFWNEQTSQYSNAYARSILCQLNGFSSLTPLLWRQLPATQKNLLLDQLQHSKALPNGTDVLSWRSRVPDGNEFPLLQQMLLLEMFETHDPSGAATRDFSKLMLKEFLEWHTLSINEHHALELEPAMAAFIINLMKTHHYRDYSHVALPSVLSKIASKIRLNRLDTIIIAATLFALWSVHLFFDLNQQPPLFGALDAQLNSAYANREISPVLQSALLIIEHYPEQAAQARLFAGNILMSSNKPEEAGLFFRDVRLEFPDSPGPMISLGLAYQLQGRFTEAAQVYDEFTYLFDEIFPDLVDQIKRNRYLMEEGFRSPPKWAEIYRYQLMHEL